MVHALSSSLTLIRVQFLSWLLAICLASIPTQSHSVHHQTDMSFSTFRQKARQLAEAAREASPLDAEDTLLACKADIAECVHYIRPDCDVRTFAADRQLLSDLGQIAMLAIKAITARGSSLSLDRGVKSPLPPPRQQTASLLCSQQLQLQVTCCCTDMPARLVSACEHITLLCLAGTHSTLGPPTHQQVWVPWLYVPPSPFVPCPVVELL